MKKLLVVPLALIAMAAGAATRLAQDQCGPFTDVTPALCPYVLEIFYLGITAGTSATTFSPDNPVTRGQAAVFVSKAINQTLARSSRRAALGQWWTTTPQYVNGLGTTSVGVQPLGVAWDGADIWVGNAGDSTVSRVRASDGKLLETWTTSDPGPHAVLAALGRIFVLTGGLDGGKLFEIDPSQPPGAATEVAAIGNAANTMAFDGTNIFVSNCGGIAHDVYLSIVTPGPTLPWSVTQVHNAAFSPCASLIFDGTNMWFVAGDALRLDASGNVLQTVPLSGGDSFGAFDGANLWLAGVSVMDVVRASTGAIVATLPANGLTTPRGVAFDGERILVTNYFGNSVSLWRAADLTPLGSFDTGDSSQPFGACSDGTNFWIALSGVGIGPGRLARF